MDSSSSFKSPGLAGTSEDAASGHDAGALGGGKTGSASASKSYGVDTDQMTELASERAGELQKLLADEIRARPMRALGWAAAAGVIFGFWAAK